MLCIIVPNLQTASPEFFHVFVLAILYCTCPVSSPRLGIEGKHSFSTLLTRNEGTTNYSGECLNVTSK